MGISAAAAPVNRSFWNASALNVPGVAWAVSAPAVIVLAWSPNASLGLTGRGGPSGETFATCVDRSAAAAIVATESLLGATAAANEDATRTSTIPHAYTRARIASPSGSRRACRARRPQCVVPGTRSEPEEISRSETRIARVQMLIETTRRSGCHELSARCPTPPLRQAPRGRETSREIEEDHGYAGALVR